MKNNTTHIEILKNGRELYSKAADFIIQTSEKAIREKGYLTIALSGGSTPKKLYEELVKHHRSKSIWRHAFFFWSDERPVKLEHPESNAGMAMQHLLRPLNIAAEQIYTVPTDRIPIQRVAAAYEDDLLDFFRQHNSDPRFDLILLGIGEDGHTASLFPNTVALNENKKLIAANWVEKLNTWRITFTYPLINMAGRVLFLVTGAKKAKILNKIFTTREQQYPAQKVEPVNGESYWFIDADAAGLLTKGV